jgi:uncharacterized membrane protein
MTTPTWALSLAYWLHMLATVTWIGGLVILAIIVLPAAQRTLDKKAYADILTDIQRRFDPLGWFCLAVLVGTGMFQMSANPNYGGFLSVVDTWSTAILVKHIVFIFMIAVSAYVTWGILPKIRRLAIRQARGQEVPNSERLQRQHNRLIRLNLVLAALVLALTAIARVS